VCWNTLIPWRDLEKLYEILSKEIEILDIEKKINLRVKKAD
jgi:hypothetical protein